MKKLEKLKLHNLEEIGADEQKSMRGGGEWRTMPDGNTYWYVGEIQIGGYKEPPGGWSSICPACKAFHEHNENNSLGGVDGEPVTTPIGEYVFNTIPHNLGLGSHMNGEDIYRIRLEGQEWTLWGSRN